MNNLFTVHDDWRNMGIGMVFPPHCFKSMLIWDLLLRYMKCCCNPMWENGTYNAVLHSPTEAEICLTAFGVWQKNLHLKPGSNEYFTIKWDAVTKEH